ncbi:MAG: acyltransferase family protein [Verrucomicrobiales bacterium]
MPYRPDIDGLRALAVIGVILFHADLGLTGGFVGVDVFFVISGFLITSLILKDLKSNQFSLLGFWERRARRIFPALYVVTIITICLSYLFLLPKDFEILGGSVIGLSFFSSNIFFWKNTNSYFSGSAEEMPLLHTWSLSLEEQFYIIVPIIFLLFFKWRQFDKLFWVLSVGTLLSLLISIVGTIHYESASFYLLPTRAWELGAGSIIATSRPIKSYRLRTIFSVLGILSILFSFIFYDRSSSFPGLSAVPPVLGAALIIWSGVGFREISRLPIVLKVLSIRPLVFIGLLSYSLYLWHWPLLALNEYMVIGRDSILIKFAIVLLSFLLSIISWKYIEQPIRKKKVACSRFSILSLSAVGLFSLVGCSAFILMNGGFASRVSKEISDTDNRGLSEDTFFDYDLAAKEFPENKIVLGHKGHEPSFFLWGDSHAMAIARALDLAGKEFSIGGLSVVKTSTLPILDWQTSESSQILYNEQILKYLTAEEQRKTIKHVVLAGRWWLAFNQSLKNKTNIEESLIRTITKIQSLGYSVSIFLQVPQWTDHWHTPSSFPFHYNWENFSWTYSDLKISDQLLKKRFISQNEMFERIGEKIPNLKIIDPLPVLINADGYYYFKDNNNWIYYDDDHISANGARKLKPLFHFLNSET